MTKQFSVRCGAIAAACLALAAGQALAADPGDEEALAALQAAYQQAVTPGAQADLHRELLPAVLQRVRRSHARPVDLPALAATATRALQALPAGGDPPEVFRKAIGETLRGLDPYSRYYDARAYDNQRSDASGSFGGLGLEVQASEGAVRVVAPMPGSPAARAGLTAGDLIVRVDDLPLVGVPLADAVARMRGQPGTPVSITVQRSAVGEFTVALTRDTIRRQLLHWSMEGDALVLRLTSFSGAAGAAIAQAVAEAAALRPAQALVLDLRGNPGGLLREAVKVADAFLAQGEIVSLRGNTPARDLAWRADGEQLLAGMPMVVLIDGKSASASELVADALQHGGRATVMGQRSVGKGSVQTTFALGDNRGAIKLTTSIYYGPSGQTVHQVGVGPDIELIAGTAAPGESVAPAPARAALARVDPGRCPLVKTGDPVLSCALELLRAGGVPAFLAGLAG